MALSYLLRIIKNNFALSIIYAKFAKIDTFYFKVEGRMKHFLAIKDCRKDEIVAILQKCIDIKNDFLNGIRIHSHFKDKVLAMIFEKNSTRTRISFEVGAYQLGGSAIFLSNKDIQLSRGEGVKDSARVISSMVDMIMIRTFSHSKIEEFATNSSKPVINGLSDEFHPTQLIADYLTMIENGISLGLVAPYAKNVESTPRKPIVCYIGDGNNMAHSWLFMASKLGFELRIATPKGYEANSDFINLAAQLKDENTKIIITNNPKEAANGANVITTDTWISMGQENEKEKRVRDFQGFCIDSDLMKLGDNAIFLHCLPAYRGYEVSDEVIESPQSKVFEEAENRLHAQKGIMATLLQNGEK